MLGRRNDVRLWSVDDHDAAFGGCGDVDVVQADPGASDHDQLSASGEQIVVDRGCGTDHQRVRTDHGRPQAVRGQTELDIDLMSGRAEAVETAVGDCFGHQDSSHGDMPIVPNRTNPTG